MHKDCVEMYRASALCVRVFVLLPQASRAVCALSLLITHTITLFRPSHTITVTMSHGITSRTQHATNETDEAASKATGQTISMQA